MNVLSSISSNPLFVQQIRKPKRIPTVSIMRASIRLTMLASFIAVIGSVLAEEPGGIALLVFGFLIAFLSAFPFITYATAVATVREVRDEAHELLLLTTLSNVRISYGLLWSAIYRYRAIFLFLITITPVLLIGLTYMSSFANYHQCWFRASNVSYCANIAPTFTRIGTSFLNNLFLLVYGWGFLVFGNVIGLTLGLMWRNLSIAGLGAIFISFFIGTIAVIIATSAFSSYTSLLVQIILALVGYGAAFLLMQFSRLFIRR